MIFEHTVKHDGVVYPAGMEVPADSNEPKKETSDTEKKTTRKTSK